MRWRRQARIAPTSQIPTLPHPPIFCPPSEPLSSEDKANACKLVNTVLESNPVDLETLREQAFSVGGYQLNQLRERVWPKLLQIRQADGERFRERRTAHPGEEQVQRDIGRSLWHWQRVRRWGRARLNAKRERLSDIINTVISTNPGLYYYQGYHDLIGVLVMILSNEETAFSAAVKISTTFHRESMREDFQQVTLQLSLLHPLLHHFDRELHCLFTEVQMEPYYAISWILTWFAHDLADIDLVARLFDVFLSADPLFSLYMSAAVVIYRREEILATEADFGFLHNTLVKLPVNIDFEAIIKRARIMIELLPPTKLLLTLDKSLQQTFSQQRLAFLDYPAPWEQQKTLPDWLILEEKRRLSGKKPSNRRIRRKKVQRQALLSNPAAAQKGNNEKPPLFRWVKFQVIPSKYFLAAAVIGIVACLASARTLHSILQKT